MVRAKMMCVERKQLYAGSGALEENSTWTIRLQPVYGDSPENKEWSKWTPSGEVSLQITNPKAVDQFQLGQAYFVDFVPVEQ